MSNRRLLLLLFGATFLFNLGFGMVTPVLPLFVNSLGAGPVGVAWAVSVYGIARVVSNLPGAAIARRVGGFRAMGIGALVLAIGSVLCGLAGSYGQLVVFRFLMGAGVAIPLVVGQGIVAGRPEPFGRARALSYYQASFLSGTGMGPAIGGPLADLLSHRAPFIAYGVIGLVLGLLLLFAFPATSQEGRGQQAAGRGSQGQEGSLHWIGTMFRDSPFAFVSSLTLLYHFTRTGTVHALVPLMGSERIGLTATEIGLALTAHGAANLVVTLMAGRLADRYGRRVVIVSSCCLLVAGLLGWAAGATYLAFTLSAVVWGLGAGVYGPVSAIYVSDRFEGAGLIRTLALFRTLSDVGFVAGPLALGGVVTLAGFPSAFAGSAFLIAVLAGGFARYAPEPDRQEQGR